MVDSGGRLRGPPPSVGEQAHEVRPVHLPGVSQGGGGPAARGGPAAGGKEGRPARAGQGRLPGVRADDPVVAAEVGESRSWIRQNSAPPRSWILTNSATPGRSPPPPRAAAGRTAGSPRARSTAPPA